MTLLILGSLLLVGMVADTLGRHTPLPRVTLLLLCGVLIGGAGLDLIPADFRARWFPALAQFALAMIGFLLGGELTAKKLRRAGYETMWLPESKEI